MEETHAINSFRKKYSSIKDAVTDGKNYGTVSIRQHKYPWRLQGDVVEIWEGWWLCLHNKDYIHNFTQGVTGECIDWSFSALYMGILDDIVDMINT